MSRSEQNTPDAAPAAPAPGAEAPAAQLEGGTYEVIRNRLDGHARQLRERMGQLDAARKEVFGGVETRLLGSDRISTENNCVPRDIVSIGGRLLFGYNVFVGLRAETTPADVFACYAYDGERFEPCPLDLLDSDEFRADFRNLYKFYRGTRFAKFAILGAHLFMVFRVGKDVSDVKTFKWLIRGDRLEYLDNRSDHEYVFPAQHEFEWTRVTQDMHRRGRHPHISIDDRVFVETIGGDLTIKIEDNTETGEGLYSEPVDNPDQTLADAEVHYALLDHIILVKVRPYQEESFRYFVFNEKLGEVVRVDSIAEACVLLPDGHGLIFPRGYYLQSGLLKTFDTDMEEMVFEKRLASPNGEDFLFVFYHRETGVYVLLSYNLIRQQVDTPMVCNGYCLFEDGRLVNFRSEDRPQKHHGIQIWQTPYYGPDYQVPVQQATPLYKIGNRDIVRCLAECSELQILLGKEDTYAGLYVDLARKAGTIRDSYFWIDSPEAMDLAGPLEAIRETATSAVEEFEKVLRTRQATGKEVARVAGEVRELIRQIGQARYETIDEFVDHLSRLRAARGEAISLRDLRYVDETRVDELESAVAEHARTLSGACVEFLLRDDALDPYAERVEQLARRIEQVAKVADARELGEQVAETGRQLEMLTEIVGNLKIEDATQTTAIIDNISLVFSKLNRVKSALHNRTQELAGAEGRAEFAAQIKLIDQAVINYLDVCDTPERCDEYLTRMTVQVETLESRFADFDEFVVRLAEKREELYNAFESRKVRLQEQRNRRASALQAAAQRVLKGIRNRVEGMGEVNEIHGYFASDLMIERVRETIEQLEDLGETVKAEDVRSQLKTVRQDAIRQLKDRQALYEDGENVIRLGSRRFSVNRQPLELAMVRRDGEMVYHLTGTGFFEPVTDEAFLSTRDVWDLEVCSESPTVYRAEYLAYRMLADARDAGEIDVWAGLDDESLAARVRTYMGPRYAEGYVKGVHDVDAASILRALLAIETSAGLLRHAPASRALARVFWQTSDEPLRQELSARMAGAGRMLELFQHDADVRAGYVDELREAIEAFNERDALFDAARAAPAAEYLFDELAFGGGGFVVSAAARTLRDAFGRHLDRKDYREHFDAARESACPPSSSAFEVCLDWLGGYVRREGDDALEDYVPEVAAMLSGLAPGERAGERVVEVDLSRTLTDLAGSHARIVEGRMELTYHRFMERLARHEREVVPRYQAAQRRKKQLIDRRTEELRLGEFRPRVLTTFVRNRLIDRVYLPLLGDNLAKQIGSAGDEKRTDRQGLLLLISPPGYGKTTLMEYIANRLGLIFMKINGPSIGHRVTSLDPAEAPNAAAREEIEKLNLAFEMGDNVMIYLDDIQHTHPELLQKFISLCDAQRRVEGVFKGKTRTYDLRGKRVCVVMAGNPYTESGETFRLPDMLTNRADTYNIGDIVGDNYDPFVSSYVENALTSNPVLSRLAGRSQADVYAVMEMASTDRREGIDLEGSYSADELNEYVAVMKKLFVVREVVLKVNQQYIRSAAMSDEYRTEPPFLLQGSYRNMNRIAERVVPLMNDDELWTLIESSYTQDAQTLTTGAEANLLKFKELVGRLDDDEARRWADIRKTYQRNKRFGGSDTDGVGRILRQLDSFGEGLESIRSVLSDGVMQLSRQDAGGAGDGDLRQAADAVLDRLGEIIRALHLRQSAEHLEQSRREARDVRTLVSVLEEQFQTMETWLRPVSLSQEGRGEFARELIDRFQTMVDGYSHLIDVMRSKLADPDADRP